MNWEARRSGWVKQPEDARSPFDVDYARIAHSADSGLIRIADAGTPFDGLVGSISLH
jgi:hypothetical protein